MPRWTVRKQLICPVCGDLVAEAAHTVWPGSLTVRAPAGYEIVPRRGGDLERELASRAESGPDADALRAVLRSNHTDLVYRLACPRGHVTVRTAAQLVRAVRRAPGGWARLA